MNNDFNIFIPFTKKDDEQRMVFGYASTESVDSQGEIVEKGAIEGALPDYMKFANIREMHQASAVGKAKQAMIDDKGLFLGAKIVDDNAWEKVKEGVYNGYSIGGKVLKKSGNKIKSLRLSEISIVDRPANPDAVFSMVKFNTDGQIAKVSGIKKMTDKEKKEQEDIANLFDASYILNLTKEVAHLMMMYRQLGKSTKNLENAVKNLKSAAKENLGKADYSKVNAILKAATAEFGVLQDNYAYVTSTGMKHLDISDDLKLRSAVARFGQEDFDSEEMKKSAAKKIIVKAKEFNVPISPNSEVSRVANQAEAIPVWSSNWESDYFSQQRKVLG